MTAAVQTPGPTPAPSVRCVTAHNPSPMTLAGTNTYVLAAEDAAGVVVVDPGPAEDAEAHLARVLAAAGGRPVGLILLTHRHADHTGAVEAFAAATGAPVRAGLPALCRHAPALEDGELIDAGGVRIEAWHTPGHTSDSFCFALPGTGPHGAALTGDTILGSGTTMLDFPDGTLTDYLATLERLEEAGPLTVLPAHGPVLPRLDVVAREYTDHREGRLAQIERALDDLDEDEADRITAAELAPRIYPGLDGRMAQVAEQVLAAHLAHLRR
ncbi:MBL fold metallo-hydrolase [Micrococcus sp.]|uniref:MBL fold metallo-hydrolase n=1 Tax=Micrococcus sp. TaxID=1271 RepID=UPI002A911931|nr:MBL fold metallo-hydrolase [Micrococcus sp.]MDY6054871.1 MBL fold metallo-hydrolase [Micrococcus sp.]